MQEKNQVVRLSIIAALLFLALWLTGEWTGLHALQPFGMGETGIGVSLWGILLWIGLTALLNFFIGKFRK